MVTSWTSIASNSASWSAVPKPLATTSVITQVRTGGVPIGMLMAITKTTLSTASVVTSIWTPISNNSTNWTSVPKAT